MYVRASPISVFRGEACHGSDQYITAKLLYPSRGGTVISVDLSGILVFGTVEMDVLVRRNRTWWRIRARRVVTQEGY